MIWRQERERREWNSGLCKATGTPWQRCATLDHYDYHAYIASQVRPWKIHHKPKQQTSLFGQCVSRDPNGLNYYLWIDPVIAMPMLNRKYRHVLESTVTITPAYIRDSLRKSPTQCALAEALHNDMRIRSPKHYNPYYEFVVTHDFICLLEQLDPQEPSSKFLLEIIKINPNLRLWLSDYDEHQEVKPIQVKITRIPSDFDNVLYTAEAEIIPPTVKKTSNDRQQALYKAAAGRKESFK